MCFMHHGLLVNHEEDILVSHFPRGPIRVQGRYEVGLREGKTTWGGGGEGLLDFVGAYRLVTVGGMTEPGAYLAASQPPTPQNLVIVHSRCIVRVHSRCIVVGTRSLPLHSVAWVPALQLWPTILMMATTQVQIYPPPLTPSRSVSRSYLSLPPPLFSLFLPLPAPGASRAIFC